MSKGLIINEDVWVLIENLYPDEQAELLKCLAAYHRGRDVPEMSRMVMGVYQRITLDNARFDPSRKAELSAMRSEVGKKGAEARWQNMANMANDGKNSKMPQDKKRKEEIRIDIREEREERRETSAGRFTPPTTEEVEAYIREKGYHMDAQRFVDFYSSKGWMVGKTKMRDWRAAARGWASRERSAPQKSDPSFGRRVDYDAMIQNIQYGGEA